MSEMTPREIVSELDQHIIGQKEAKRAVAISVKKRRKERWRSRCVTVGEECSCESHFVMK